MSENSIRNIKKLHRKPRKKKASTRHDLYYSERFHGHRQKKNKEYIDKILQSKTRLMVDITNFHCTYCGSAMKQTKMIETTTIANSEEQEKRGTKIIEIEESRMLILPKNEFYMVCPKCGARCRVKKTNGNNYRVISTPADVLLRKRRAEAHFYFNRLVKYGIIDSVYDAYNWLTQVTGINMYGVTTQRHIGEMGKALCEKVITESVTKLCENWDKWPKLLPVYRSNDKDTGKNLSYVNSNNELKQMIREANKKFSERTS